MGSMPMILSRNQETLNNERRSKLRMLLQKFNSALYI